MSDVSLRGVSNEEDDVLEVPDSVWDSERNESIAHPDFLRQTGSPPSNACRDIKVIYTSGWVQSSANGNTATGIQRALDVLAEAENIYNTKFSSSNQLGTAIKFNLVGGGNLCS